MNISEAMSLCHKNNIKVYGVNKKGKLFVQVEDSITKKITPSSKNHSTMIKLNEAVSKTYFYFAEKLVNKKKDKKEDSE